MSLKFNPNKQLIESTELNINGKSFVTLSSGEGTENREIIRVVRKNGTSRVGVNRTGEKIAKVTVTNPGAGYLITPTITVSQPDIISPTARVAVLSAVRDPDTGSIVSVIITDAGKGYSEPPSITFAEAPQGGVSAQATCELDTIDYELDVLGAIRTSASIVSDSATVTNLNVQNFVTPGVLLRAPRLGSYTNLTNPNLPFYGETVYPELTATPPLQDQSNRIATTQFVYNVATNDVGGRIYVSSEIGSDTNNGRSPAKPVKTIKKAAQLAAATAGRETLIVAGGEYYEDNPISIPALCSVIGDNLRLVIVRPLNPGRHMFKASNQNYMNGLTFRDALDIEGNPLYTHNFAFVFDDKQRFYFDDEIGGDSTRLDSSDSFKRRFPIGHKMFGQRSAILNLKEHTGNISTLQSLVGQSTLIVGQDTSCEATVTSIISATPLPDAEWSAEQEYALEDIIRVNNAIYKVTTAGTSGTVTFSGVLTTPKQATGGTAAYIYLGDRREASLNIIVTDGSPASSFADDEIVAYTVSSTTYQANVALFTSTRAEGEVVKYGETEVRNYVVEEIDASSWEDYPTPGDNGTLTAGSGGVVFKFDGLHDLKEFDIVFVKKPANTPAALDSFFGYQRVDEVLYDDDGFSRRIVIKKQIQPNYTSTYLPAVGQCTCRAKTKYVEISLLNSPYGFTDSTFTSYRFLDAVTFIRNNRDFIAEEITGAITSRYPDFIYPGTLTTRYRFKDSRNLIYKNLDHIADEAIGWLYAESNYVTWGTANLDKKEKCRRDVKYFLRGLANDLYDGSNKGTIAVTRSYFNAVTGAPISNGVLGVEQQSIAVFNKASQLAKLAVTNSLPLTATYSTIQAYRDLSLTHDPTTGLNVNEDNCTNVRNAITTLTTILTSAISAGNLNSVPEVSSADGASDGENFCKRDIKHILNAVIADLPYGGNATSIEAAKSYRNNSTSSIEYIDNQHRQSRFAFRLARDYAILAMRNWQTKINMTFTEDSDIVEVNSTVGLVPKMRLYSYNLSNVQVETDYYVKEVLSPTQVRIWKYNTGLSGSDHTFAAGEASGVKTRPINLKLAEGETSLTLPWTDNLVPRTTDYPEFPECANVASTLVTLFTLITDIVTNETDDRYFDATDLIEFNKDFIADEVSGWLKETYDGFAYPLPTFTKVVIDTSTPDTYPSFIKITNLNNVKVGQLVTSGDAIQNNTYISSINVEDKILYLTKSLESDTDSVTIHPDVYLDESMRYKDASNLILKNKDEIADKALAQIAVEYPDFNFPGNSVTDEFSRFADGYRLITQNIKEIVDRSSAEIAVQHPDFYFPGDIQTTDKSRFKDAYRLIQLNRTEIIDGAYAVMSAAGLPSPAPTDLESKCKRDIGFLVDYVSLDLFVGGNTYARKFILSYFNGNTFISNGLAGEVTQSITAFNAARDLMKQAIANQLTVKDLTITPDPVTGSNTNANSCANVQSSITSLVAVVTDVLTSLDLNDLATENDGNNNRYEDAADLIYNNKQEIIDRAAAQIAIDYPDFYYPGDPQTTTTSRYKDSYRLIQLNRQEIVDTAWSNALSQYPAISGTQTKCKRDIGYFIDAISLDLSQGGGNVYSRKFVLQYFNNGAPISNGLVGEEAQSVYAFQQARDEMNKAITNQLTVKDLTITADPTPGTGTPSNTNSTSCSNVQTTITNLTSLVTGIISAGNLNNLPSESFGVIPAGETKCKRDIGHFVNAIESDLRQLTDYNTRSFLTYYFTPDGTSWISDGLQGEESKSITAFEKARDVINQAITNQLYYKDLTITADPLTGSNTDPTSCADVQTLVTNLTSLTTDTISDGSLGTSRSSFLAAASYDVLVGEIKCKRDIRYFVEAVSLDVFTKGNKYSREFVNQYFTNVSSPLSNGLVGETVQSITAFNMARDMMKKAVTNQLFFKDLTLSEGPAEYNGGGGDIPLLPSGNAASCVDVQAAITSLTDIITDVITAGSLTGLDAFPETQGEFGIGETKCRRDIGFIIDAVAKDIADGGNWRSVNAARYYFQEGQPISNGLVDEEVASITAFNRARDLMVDAIRNQLNYRDLSITTDPERLTNFDKYACSNVASSINTLVSIITTTIDDGDLDSLDSITVSRGSYSVNEIKCKRDIKFMIDAVINDITLNDSNKNSIQYANFYKQQNGNITLIDSQLIQSVAAFRKTRDLCILAMRNWLEFPQKQYYQKKYTDLNYVRDEFVIEDDQTPYCANVATAITNRFDTIINILTGNADNENLDTANQIAINENFIINEALAAGEANFPAVSIPNITKCKRDLRFILRDVQRDIILGGTVGITRSADSYLTGATLDVGFVGDQLGKTLFIYEYAKHMAIAATRNWHFELRNCTTVSGNNVVTVPNTNGIVLGMRVSANQFRYTDPTPDSYAYVIDIDRENNTVTLGKSKSLTAVNFPANVSTSTATLYFTFSEVGAPWFDAANSIAANKTFIAQESVGYIEDIYPYLTTLNASPSYVDIVSDYDNATCQRDIGYVLDAFIHDLRFGGNAETIRAAEFYRDASGHLDYVGNQLIQSLETFEKVKDLAILSIRNWKTGASTTYTKEYATANYTVNNNLLADPAGYPECAFVEATIESLFQQFIDVLTNNSGGTKIDAARLIARNFVYIAEESLGAADNEYPLVTVPNEAKCLRDIQLIMTAWIKDLITGGNSGSVQATQAYLTNTGAVTFIQDELEKSRYAYEYAKDLVKLAVTNNLPAGTYTTETPYTDLSILPDPATGDNTDPASCAAIQSTVETLWEILDDTLAQSGAPLPTATYGTQYNPRKYYPTNFPGIFAGGYFSGLQRASTDEFITEDTSYPECNSIVNSLINIFAILDSVLNGNPLPEVTNDNVATITTNSGTLYNPTIVQGSGTMIDAGNRPVIRGRMINANDIIEVSPYIQNCSIISFLGGGGCEVDGSKVKQRNVPRPGLREDGKSILAQQGKSMVANAFTIISQGGTGYRVNNDGYCQLVSVFCIFCQDGILAESGGYASVTNSASNFGTYALRAVGYRAEPYEFDIGVVGEIGTTSAGKTVFRVNGLGRRPQENFVMKIDGYENVVSDIEYFVTVVTQTTVGGTGEVSSRVEFNDALLLRNKQSGALVNLNTSELIGKTIRLFRPSIINSSGHSFEYIGSGTDYYGLPENGGQKIEDNEQVSQRYGRVYASGTDEAGDFKVGRTVKMENRTGNIFFTGQVSISEIEFLRIRGGDLVVTGFDASPTLGGAASTNQKLPTQKAVRDFVTNNVGPYFGKPYSTNPIPNALVELGNDGKINLDQIPPIRPFKVYTVNNSTERLALEGLNSGDIAVQVTKVNDTINDTDVDVANSRIYTPKTGFSSGQIVTIVSVPGSPIVTNAGPLEAGDLYYLIVDLPYIQLASSPENVIDEVPLTITSAGSGDTTIQIATGTVSYILNNDVDTQFLAYPPNENVTFNNGSLVIGSSTGAIGSVTSTVYGTVYSISTTSGGNVYLNETPSIVISAPDQPGGVQATANAVVVGNQISSITITERGSGYDEPPTVSVSLGEIAWSAGQLYDVDDLIYVNTNLYIITTTGTSGGVAFSGQSSTPQAADGGTCFYSYVGERAELVSFVESRVYINIENGVKFTDVDNINSHNATPISVNLSRVINTSGSNEFNWVPLTSASIDAASITTGTISTSRLALPNSGSANSFTFLRGDQSYKPVVQGVKLPETKFLAKTILSSDAGLSYITLPLTGLVQSGQRVEGNGIAADTIVIDTLTVGGNTRVSISSLLVDDVPKDQVITFIRTETPLQFDSNFTKGAYAADIFIENPGDYYQSTITTGSIGQNTIDVVDVSKAVLGQKVTADGVATNATITDIDVISGTAGIITLSANNTANITNKQVTFGVAFTTGTYNNVELFGSNTGTGAKATFTVQGGVITSAKITDGGTGYTEDFEIDPIPGVLGLGTGAKLTALASTQQTYFSNVELDIKRVTNQTTSLDPFGTVGVARFQKSQFTYGPNGALTLKTGPESGLDSDLLDGKQGTFYLDASNLEAGTLRTDRLSGTYSIDITGKSGTTTRVETITDSINAVPAPSAYASGLSLALRISENFRSTVADRTLENEGTRVTLMTVRPSGIGTDAGGGGLKQLAFTDGTINVGTGGGGASSATTIDDVVPNLYIRGTGNIIPTDPTNAWSPWYKVWTSGNDGFGSGLDADKLQNKDSKWYTNALNIDGGSINDARLQPIMTTKRFLESLTTVRYLDKPHYELYFSGRLNNGDLNFAIGNTYSLYNDILQVVGQVTLKQIEQKFPVENVKTELNYVVLTVQLDSGSIGSATKVGFTGFEQAWSSLRISPFATYISSTLQDDGTGARLILGRNDGNNVGNNTPSNGAIIDFHSSGAFNDYDVRIQVTGGNISNGNGALNITGNGFTYNNNTVWHSGNDNDNSGLNANFLQGITKSQVMRSDENTSTSGNLTVTGTTTLQSFVTINDAAQLADNTTIDPDSYINKVVAGNIADGGGWGALGIGGNAGTGKSWAIGHNGTSLYFGIGNGSAANTLAAWAQVDADRTIRLFAKDNSSIFFSSGANDYRIWNENNDGAGSGLDADLLDGRDWYTRDYSILRTSGDLIAGGIYKNAGVTKYQTSNFGFLIQHSDASGVSAGAGGRLDFVFGTNTTRGTDVNVTNSLTFSFDKSGQLIIPASNGTAPLSVSSTTKVANLNADLLDDQTGAYYTNMNNADAGTLAAVRGGTGINSYAVGDIIYATATTPTLGKLAIGTANQILTVNAGATAPQWTTPSTITVGAATKVAITSDTNTNTSYSVGFFASGSTPTDLRYTTDATNGLTFNPSTGTLKAASFLGSFSGNATSSTNVSGGAAGSIPYQTAASTTTLLSIGTAGQVLVVNPGATAPSWTSQINITAGNIVGGAQGELLYQSASGTTSKLAVGTNGQILRTNGAGANPSWVSQNTITAGNIDGGSAGQILYQSGAGATAKLSIGTAGQVLVVNTGATAPQWVTSTTLVAGNISSITADNGSLLYQSAVNTTSKLSQGTTNQVLISGGSGAAPTWTNQTSITAGNITGGAAGSLVYQTGSGASTTLAIGTAAQVLIVNPGATAPAWTAQSNITAGNINGGVQGDILYQSAASTTAKLAAGTSGAVLTTGGTGANPAWTAQSSLIVGSISGGAAGDLLYQSGSNATAKLGIGTAGFVLVVSGTNVPSWANANTLTAGNITGGAAGNILYQSGAGATAKLASTVNNGWVLSYNTTSNAPQWTDPGTLTVSLAANISGGAAGQVLYQSANGTTSKLAAGAATQVLVGGASAPAWSNISGLAVASATNLRLAANNVAGSIAYNTAADTTTGLAIGSAGAILTVNTGATAPQWSTPSTLSVGSATNVTGGSAGQILYQSGTGATAKLGAGANTQVLIGGATAPAWSNISGLAVASAVNVVPATNNTTGALLYQSAASTTAGIAAVAAGSVLTSNGTAAAPTWTTRSTIVDIGAATNVRPVANNVAGALLYQSAANTTTGVAVGTATQVLRYSLAGTAPVWGDSSNVIEFPATNSAYPLLANTPYAKFYMIELWGAGGGGGGGSGRRSATNAAQSGGGGGGGGGYAMTILPRSVLASGNINVTVGAGGSQGGGGVATVVSTTTINATGGGNGGITSVSLPMANGLSSIFLSAYSGFGGAGGVSAALPGTGSVNTTLTTGAFAAMVTYSTTTVSGSQGQGTSILGAPTTLLFSNANANNGKMGSGGGGGGSIGSVGNVLTSGTTPDILIGINNAGVLGTAGTTVTAGNIGNNRTATAGTVNHGLGGLGGGGGGSLLRSGTTITALMQAGNGGNGAQGGGGGGGGGAARAAMNTAGTMVVRGGNGGFGGAGYVRITWF
jgi:hypothetical protein